MSNRNRKVVVYWVKDKKVGIENLSCVPEGSRFVGAATPVQFHGDKKFYPAKIKLISGEYRLIFVRICWIRVLHVKLTSNGSPRRAA